MNEKVETTMQAIDVLRKITTATVLGEKPSIPKKEEWLFRVIGFVHRYKADESQHGPFVKFYGDFKATRYADNKAYRAGQAIFPSPLDDILCAQLLQNINPETGEALKCQFAADIGVKPGRGPTGYEWVVRPIIEMQQQDPLAVLEKNVQALLPKK